MWSSSCFSSVFLLPQFFLWMRIVFFLISPSALFWIIALLPVEKSIMFNCTTMYQSLYTMFSWFFSFHSASIPGGHSNSQEISPVHYSFEHNSIPSPTYTTICLAIPQLKGIHSFYICYWSRPISILLIFALGCSFRVHIPNQIPIDPCDQTVVFLLCFYSHSSFSGCE